MSKSKHMESGDTLEDDFEYLSDGEGAGERFDDSEIEDYDGGNKSLSAGSKRKVGGTPEKKKNKLKKARIEENNIPLGKRPHASQFEILNDSQKQALENLSSFELEERRIPESSIKDTSRFALDHTLVHLESFLKFAVADWKSKLLIKDANTAFTKDNIHGKIGKDGKQKDNSKSKKTDTKNKKPLETSKDLPKGSPVVLIVSASGIRSVDVIRALPLFTEAAKVGKLFAKHFKVPEQVNFLKNTCTHICVGTPNRIDKLISDGALHLDRLELVLLDCHKDAKRRTLLDIHEIRVDLFKMLGLKVLDERIRSGLTKIALF
ncbi:hypothetical protein BX616_010811 [Lobosporangium transversale]|nr:hypothetical protein BX616_010811 [Lobosporangium transversale]